MEFSVANVVQMAFFGETRSMLCQIEILSIGLILDSSDKPAQLIVVGLAVDCQDVEVTVNNPPESKLTAQAAFESDGVTFRAIVDVQNKLNCDKIVGVVARCKSSSSHCEHRLSFDVDCDKWKIKTGDCPSEVVQWMASPLFGPDSAKVVSPSPCLEAGTYTIQAKTVWPIQVPQPEPDCSFSWMKGQTVADLELLLGVVDDAIAVTLGEGESVWLSVTVKCGECPLSSKLIKLTGCEGPICAQQVSIQVIDLATNNVVSPKDAAKNRYCVPDGCYELRVVPSADLTGYTFSWSEPTAESCPPSPSGSAGSGSRVVRVFAQKPMNVAVYAEHPTCGVLTGWVRFDCEGMDPGDSGQEDRGGGDSGDPEIPGSPIPKVPDATEIVPIPKTGVGGRGGGGGCGFGNLWACCPIVCGLVTVATAAIIPAYELGSVAGGVAAITTVVFAMFMYAACCAFSPACEICEPVVCFVAYGTAILMLAMIAAATGLISMGALVFYTAALGLISVSTGLVCSAAKGLKELIDAIKDSL